MNQKEESGEFIKWFADLDKSSGSVAGGKGANLAEIYNLKIRVPPGFVVTAQAYDYFLESSGQLDRIKKLLSKINYEDTKQLDETTKEIRELIINSSLPKRMEQEIVEAYESLSADEILQEASAYNLVRGGIEPTFVAVRSSATTEDLAEASFAGQQETFLNIKGNEGLLKAIKKCFASLFTSRATYYRNKQGFADSKSSLAVVVQRMVDSDKSGVMFSKNPAQNNDNTVIEAVYGLGEGIVSGRITPDTYIVSPELKIISKKISEKKIALVRDSSGSMQVSNLREEKSKYQVLSDHDIIKLAEMGLKLENHYGKPQDVEFAIERDELFIVQTRPITTLGKRSEVGREIDGEVFLTGLAASPGIASGRVKIVRSLDDLQKIKEGDILVTQMTNPDMVVSMQKSAAIVTDEGGLTAHAAIVSREMGIPAVVGTQEATKKLKDGELITVDGFTGKVYKGKTLESVQKEVLPVTAKTKIEIKVMVDLPSFADRAAKTKLKKVGLTRIEGIIAESGKHPEYFLKQGKIKDYEEVIFKGVQGIANHFEELWVRTSDIRSDEFQHLEGASQKVEVNPMLGMHGIRYGLKKPEIIKSELRALKRVSHSGKKIGVLLPQVISVDEVKKVKEILKELNFLDAKIGVMVETPAAVQIIKNLCEEGIDFISFGTNDLTQYILAIDRGNKEVQYLYDEMNPAVLYQLDYVIRVCKRFGVETSICGQAGSKKEMVKYLVEKGIDSISVNADKAAEITDYVHELERELVLGTDKEPRKYDPKASNSKEEEFKKKRVERDIRAIEEEKREYLAKQELKKEIKNEINEEESTSSKLGQSKEEVSPKDEFDDKPEFTSEEQIKEELGQVD